MIARSAINAATSASAALFACSALARSASTVKGSLPGAIRNFSKSDFFAATSAEATLTLCSAVARAESMVNAEAVVSEVSLLLVASPHSRSSAERLASCSFVAPNGSHPFDLYHFATAALVCRSKIPSTRPGSKPSFLSPCSNWRTSSP